MALSPGTRFGPYQIVAVLGAGGMGEVYRATDAALGRDVAIKVLPEIFLQDRERLVRFEREARVLASLSHPHVGAIFGLEQAGDVRGLVLELIEGPTLQERLAAAPLPVPEALNLARQVADALDAAHGKGIVHRDLKPANIKITPSGIVKVLDFGLAKSTQDEAGSLESPDAATVAGATRYGAVLGTAAYMSPEQARGQAVTKQTDIWAFGCVLYEMLTGRTAFGRDTTSDTIVAILDREPDWTLLPGTTPASVRRLLERCLEKDTRERLRDIGDARLELEHELSDLRTARRVRDSGSPEKVTTGRPSAGRRNLVAGGAIALAVVTVGVALLLMANRREGPPAPVIEAPQQLTNFNDSALHPALSPDGRMLTFIKGGRFADSAPAGQVYVKMLPDGDPVPLTRDVSNKELPVFTPDGGRIIYGTIAPGWKWDSWQVPVLGGEPTLFIPNASGLSWIDGRQMIYAAIMSGVHMGIKTATEPSRARDIYFPRIEGGMAHRAARSPDGQSLLVVEMDGNGWLPCRQMPFDGSTTGRQVGPLDGQCTTAAWSPDGRWMYFSSSAGGGYHIWRQRFPGGTPEQITFGPTEQEGTALSPDGTHLITSMGLQLANIFLSGPDGERQLTSEGLAMLPTFAPAGQRVFYMMRTGARGYISGELWSVNVATGERQRMLPGVVMTNYSLSADEQRVVFTTTGNENGDGLWLADLDRRSPPRQLTGETGTRAFFGAPGEIVYTDQGQVRHLFRIREDGTGREMVFPEPVVNLINVSPDGRFAVVLTPRGSTGGTRVRLISLRGEASMEVCNDECAIGFGPNRIQAPMVGWSRDGKSLYVGLQWFSLRRTAKTVVLPYRSDLPLATQYPRDLTTEEGVAANPGARVINSGNVFPVDGISHLVWRLTTQSNLYQIRLDP